MASLPATVLAVLVTALLVAAVTVVIRARFESPRQRTVIRVRHVLGPALLVALVVGLGLTPLGATTVALAWEVGDDAPDAVPVGEAEHRTIAAPVQALPGTTYIVRGRGVTVEAWERTDDGLAVAVELPATDEAGPREATVRLTPYPATLPRRTLAALHEAHPLAAMAGATGAVLGPLYLLGRVALDGDRPVFRSRRRWLRRRLGG